MNKRMIWALSLIAVCVVVFVFNNDKQTLDLGFSKVKSVSAFIYLGFTTVGVVIGTLLR
jgi:hypothetical protein